MSGDFTRDRWGRPLIVPAAGGKPVAYQRVSSFGQGLENQYGLNKWKQRMVLLGAVDRPDLIQLASAARADDRKLDGLVEQLLDAGGASRAANTGTAIHDVLAQVDAGTLDIGQVPDGFLGPVQAWLDMVAALGWHPVEDMIELHVVNDRYQAAGSLDNICRRPDGTLVVVDKKTGKSIGQRPLAYMVQLAIYATSDIYDLDSGERRPLGVATDVAYIAHVPAAGGDPVMYEVGVAEGLRLADLALAVKTAEKQASPVRRVDPPAASPELPAPAPVEPADGELERAAARRLWLADRISVILEDPRGRPLLGQYWPVDVPKLSAGVPLAYEDVVAVDAALSWIETLIEAPFAGADPGAPVVSPLAPVASGPLVRTKPAEGGVVDKETLSALESEIGRLDPAATEIVQRIAREANKAKQSISLRQRPSVRRFEIARMLISLVADWPDYDVIHSILQQLTDTRTDDVGELVGGLTVEQVTSIIGHLPVLARTGEITIGPDGQMAIQTNNNQNKENQ